MLKNIPTILSPELIKVLAEMGHGDTIVLADANYPAQSANVPHIVRADGIPIPELLDAILTLLPIDTFVKQPIGLMQVVDGDCYVPEIQDEYVHILSNHNIEKSNIAYYERFEFYTQANNAYCVVATGERARYANIILKKGVIEDE